MLGPRLLPALRPRILVDEAWCPRETNREHIAEAVASGLMSVQLQTSVPCAFGVLTVLDEDQAAKRSYAGENHGESWGKTAVEMAVLRQEALGLAKKGTINLGFSDEESSKAMPKAGVGEKKVFF